jgi:hypothetical protein
MAVNARCLYESAYLTNADVTLYTAPASVRVIIDKVTVTNVTAGAITVTIRVVASGGTAGTSNTIMSAKSLAAGECYTCPEVVGQTLNTGDFVSALASANTSIVIRFSGREIT